MWAQFTRQIAKWQLSINKSAAVPRETAAHNLNSTQFGRNVLDVEVFHVQRIVFDKAAARFDLIAHQNGEDLIGLDRIINPHL